MGQKIIKQVLMRVFCAGVILTAGTKYLYPQFIVSDVESKGSREIIKAEEKKDGGSLPVYIAFNIRAEKVPLTEDTVKISWDVNPVFKEDFVVGRSLEIVDTPERALSAKTVQTLPAGTNNVVVDSGLEAGKYYYVVLSRDKLTARDIELYRDVNFISFPIIIDAPVTATVDTVTMLSAQKTGPSSVKLSWDKVGSQNFNYLIYRSSSVINSEQSLKKSTKIAIVSNKFFYDDTDISEPGVYFYAVLLDNYTQKDFSFFPDQNYTSEGVEIARSSAGSATVVDAGSGIYHFTSISAQKKGRDLLVKWSYKGKPNKVSYSLFRSPKIISDKNLIRDEYVIDYIDPDKKEYLIYEPPAGVYYYGIITSESYYDDLYKIESGRNVTARPVSVDTAPSKAEPESVPDVPEREVISDIDYILKSSYFKNDFSSAVERLKKALPLLNSQKDIARANLFIGRSYLEMNRYSEALEYLVLSSVNRYYREEAEFWREYAMLHLTGD